MVETKRIKIKKVFKAEGKKPHTLIAWDEARYYSFVKMEGIDQIVKGQEIELDVEEKPMYQGTKQFEIKKIHAHSGSAKEATSEITPPNSVLPIPGSDFSVAENLKKAKEIAGEFSDDPALIVEIMREGFELWLQERKEKVWGGKFP